MYEKTFPNKRFKQTMEFLEKHIPKDQIILDLGVPNPLSKIMIKRGYTVTNTDGEDLDNNYTNAVHFKGNVVTAFEIFEHLFAPYNVLKELKADKLVASVPLKLWFAEAYWNEADDWDKHYHEFEKKTVRLFT